MSKKIKAVVKLNLNAGKATPVPPVGPVLGQYGINIANFCKEYNAKTLDKIGFIIPVKVTIFEDKSYSFILKTPPTSTLLLKFANIKKGATSSTRETIGVLTREQIEEIVLIKKEDLNTNDLEKRILILAGTAKNMGIKFLL